jgi:hypothetical protein
LEGAAVLSQQLLFFEDDEWKLEDSFWRFHHANPHVYDVLVELAKAWRLRRGAASKCGIGMLFEVARWHLALRTEGEPIQLNNNYRAFYARLLMKREPGLVGLFELREQKREFDP